MNKIDVSLGATQETLLIPLLGRAMSSRRKPDLLHDPQAEKIVDQLNYDFSKWQSARSLWGAVLRTRMMDDDVRAFLEDHPAGTVVEIGCGLNTRFERLDNGQVHWFDLDLPDAIALRKQFFEDSERQRMIGASALDTGWFDQVKSTGGPYCFVSEAALIYLDLNQAEQVIRQIAETFPGAWVILDTTPKVMVDGQARHDAMKHLPRQSWFRWACDDPRDLERLGLTLVRSRNFLDAPPELARFIPRIVRWFMRWTPFKSARSSRGYRLNRFLVRSKKN